MTKISDTELDVFPLCLGGNVFGWTADEDASFAVLDAYVAAGGNFIDTADLYAGGESEKIIGRWLARRGRRDDIVIATKVGMAGERANLKPETIRAAAEDSLRSLGVDHIDLYYAHRDDLGTPIEETLSAFDELVREGKVRHIAASNYEAPRLAAALKISETEGLARYVALQPHYNLMERGFEEDLADLCARENLGVLPYFGLARGFLTGKYRPGGPEGDSPRAERAREYLNERRGVAVLGALDEIAAAHDTSLGAVALAWLLAQPTVVAPIASARDTEQLAGLLPIADLTLSADELERLTSASV
ncbi:aldo/keto reductase [Actinoallomurus iriomotensis]|uniref:NADP-dependent aryl-alcohol dehydrogenase n=1 Tax=Actinoallomurus iriomotensis TaxID=478107 RepID=A0A9W6RIX8_9ACTN|nr:aldo/keto reductase [Actinoallomurus iriomotensis]GLY76379.1 NADP-dependent aryl-alcohol dehydrogenase [Actinoallomurus iriomotensis]